MQITLNIIEEAKETNFVDQYQARLLLNLASSTDETLDDLIEVLMKFASDEIETMTGRFFAEETVKNTFRELNSDCKRLWVTHYPITDVSSVVENGSTLTEDVDFEVDSQSGRITRLGGVWSEPVMVTYTGGYDMPVDCPPALQQAAIIMAREAYYQSTRGDQSIRMVAHKESRVMYFDPNAKGAAAGSSSGSPARRAVANLLQAYMRYYV